MQDCKHWCDWLNPGYGRTYSKEVLSKSVWFMKTVEISSAKWTVIDIGMINLACLALLFFFVCFNWGVSAYICIYVYISVCADMYV